MNDTESLVLGMMMDTLDRIVDEKERQPVNKGKIEISINPVALSFALDDIRLILVAAKIWIDHPETKEKIEGAAQGLQSISSLLRSSR